GTGGRANDRPSSLDHAGSSAAPAVAFKNSRRRNVVGSQSTVTLIQATTRSPSVRAAPAQTEDHSRRRLRRPTVSPGGNDDRRRHPGVADELFADHVAPPRPGTP